MNEEKTLRDLSFLVFFLLFIIKKELNSEIHSWSPV
jgi:hypothetical protein